MRVREKFRLIISLKEPKAISPKNRDVYGWRIYQQEDNTLFIPYSQRNAKDIKAKKIVLSIKRKARNQIYQFLERYTVLLNFPLYCPKCKQETLIEAKKLQVTVIEDIDKKRDDKER